MQDTELTHNTSQNDEMNLFEVTNWHENMENNFIKIASYRTGRGRLLGGILY